MVGNYYKRVFYIDHVKDLHILLAVVLASNKHLPSACLYMSQEGPSGGIGLMGGLYMNIGYLCTEYLVGIHNLQMVYAGYYSGIPVASAGHQSHTANPFVVWGGKIGGPFHDNYTELYSHCLDLVVLLDTNCSGSVVGLTWDSEHY